MSFYFAILSVSCFIEEDLRSSLRPVGSSFGV